MELIALLSSDNGSWGQVAGLIKFGDWDNIIIVGDEPAKNFTSEKPFDFVKVDLGKKLKDLKEEVAQKIKGKVSGTEVALTIASGDGKEHMALISALINYPAGIRFAALTKEGIIDL